MKSSEPRSWKSYFKDNYVVGFLVQQQQSCAHRRSKMKGSARLVDNILPENFFEMYEVKVEVEVIVIDFVMKLFYRCRWILLLRVK